MLWARWSRSGRRWARARRGGKTAAAVRSWDEDLAAEAARKLGDAAAADLLRICPNAISETYKADVPAAYAVNDLMRVRSLLASGEDVAFDLWEAEGYTGGRPASFGTSFAG